MPEYRLPDDTLAICAAQLENIIRTIPDKLNSFTEAELSLPPAPGKWSKKQIIGHLIDSATNNHHRFIRAQHEDLPVIVYDQERWNEHGYYSGMSSHALIGFWTMYNRHLLELIQHIPAGALERECAFPDGSRHSIRWLFEDYVRHLEHHLRQLAVYP
jgi:hypothetical protein